MSQGAEVDMIKQHDGHFSINVKTKSRTVFDFGIGASAKLILIVIKSYFKPRVVDLMGLTILQQQVMF